MWEKKMFLILTILNESYKEWYERACTQDLWTDVLTETEKRMELAKTYWTLSQINHQIFGDLSIHI